MIVWTGAEGAEYDPATDRWRRIPLAPLLRHTGHTAVWSGGEMVVWGDYCCGRRVCFGGAAYDPSPGVWRSLPRSPLGSRDSHAAVGTPGGGMFVWGGCCRRGYLADGALYER